MDSAKRSQLSSLNYPLTKNVVKEKSFTFALRIVKLCRYLNDEKHEFVLSKQLLRSGTAVAALVREALSRLKANPTSSTKWQSL